MIGLQLAGTSFVALLLIAVAASIWGEDAPEWMKVWGGCTGLVSILGIGIGIVIWIWSL
jgi:hypothetical protein